MSRNKLTLLILALSLIFCGASALLFSHLANSPGMGQAQRLDTEFEIHEGDTWQELGMRLKKENLIRSLLWYKIQLRLRKEPITLKAGSYTWPRFLTTKEIIDFFQVAQPQKTYAVTIPEGLTRREVALRLETKGILSAQDFLDESSHVNKYSRKYALPIPEALTSGHRGESSLEGFLFPDTYFFPKKYSAARVLDLMLKNFVIHLQEVLPDWQSYNADELYPKIVLASVVQKEYRAEQEAPVIASVFQNRLNRGIRLESCATIVYVLTEELGRSHPQRILFRDLEEKSPFNTYLNQGLPPHPIANVGAVALNAAFHQAETDYLFFVVEDTVEGTHKFSASLADHNAAREAYINNYFR